MPVKGLDRFRQLIQEHQGADEANQLTGPEIKSALAELKPADRAKARNLALEAMMKANLSNDALGPLQCFLGVKHGEFPTKKGPSTAGTQTFALRLFEAQGVNTVGRSQVWKWEAEQCLKTLGHGANKEEVNEAVRTMLCTAELTPDALASTRLFVEESRMISKETLKWPSDDRPVDFGVLTDKLCETVEHAYTVEALPVAGIVTPPTHPEASTVTPHTPETPTTAPVETSTEPISVPFSGLTWLDGTTKETPTGTTTPTVAHPEASIVEPTSPETPTTAPVETSTEPFVGSVPFTGLTWLDGSTKETSTGTTSPIATTTPTVAPNSPETPTTAPTAPVETSTQPVVGSVPFTGLTWSGPPTPEFALDEGDETFDTRIKAENLVEMEKYSGRPPLHSIMSIGVQLGMEQGRRAVMSSPEVKNAGSQIDAAEQALANGNVSQTRQALVNFIQALQSPSMQSPLSSLVKQDGTVDWPEGDLPVMMEELEAPMRTLLKDAFKMERINPDEDISWTGPRSPQFLNSLPYEVRLSAENLRKEAVEQGREPIDELVSITLEMGVEQGRRMSVAQDFSPALQTAYTALTALNNGYPDNAKFMLPMIRQMWIA